MTGVDWDDDDDDQRCSTCSSSSSSSSDSEFDYYLDRRLRPTTPAAPRLLRHVGENFLYASGDAGGGGGRAAGAFLSPARCVRSPSAGRVVPGGWPRDDRRGRRRRKQTGKRCVVS